MKIRLLLLISILLSGFLEAQTLAFPDSAAVVKNNVKTARIFFKAKDGKRYLQKRLVYDRLGRIIVESEGENSYYYEYQYDQKSRLTSATQRTADGAFIQKFTVEYNEKDSTRKISFYSSSDTLQADRIYIYDQSENKIREEQHSRYGFYYLYMYTYDKDGKLIASYDSASLDHVACYRVNNQLIRKRRYDPNGKVLHEYRFTYNTKGELSAISDSTGLIPTVKYELLYNDWGQITEYRRDGQKMKEPEITRFRAEYAQVLPPTDATDEGDYGLPVPEMVTTHSFTYDKKGNIIRDDLVQKQGSMSETYVYEYEYEFY